MEQEPEFLDEETILEFHAEQIRLYGGDGGMRDPAGFSSAVAAPQQVWCYQQDATIFDIAATYAYNIAQSQAFVDGNKRTGLQAALAFLKVNGYIVESDLKLLYEETIRLHEGREAKAAFSEHLRKCSVRQSGLTKFIRSIFEIWRAVYSG